VAVFGVLGGAGNGGFCFGVLLGQSASQSRLGAAKRDTRRVRLLFLVRSALSF
jgi:hypothetical protein